MDNSAKHIGKGIIAGFIATIVLSLLMAIKNGMGYLPETDVIHMLSGIVGRPDQPGIGWLVHFFIGTIAWGVIFAWLAPVFSGQMWQRGIEFGILAWLLMMIVVMPMAGAGLFGMNLGIMAPVMTLVLHIVYGAVLGYSYEKLLAHESMTEVTGRHAH